MMAECKVGARVFALTICAVLFRGFIEPFSLFLKWITCYLPNFTGASFLKFCKMHCMKPNHKVYTFEIFT